MKANIDDEFIGDLDKIYNSDDLNAAKQNGSDDEDSSVSEASKDIEREVVVNSIDKSLDENCYDPHDFGVAEDLASEKVLKGFLGPKKNPNTKKNFWANKKPPNAGRQGVRDSRTPQPLARLPLASDINSINDAFQILISDQMVQLIVDKTNTRIHHVKVTYLSITTNPIKTLLFAFLINVSSMYSSISSTSVVFLDSQCIRM